MAHIPVPQTSFGTNVYDTLTALETVTDPTARDALYRWLSEELYFFSPRLQAEEPLLYAAARTAFFRHTGEVVETLLTPPGPDCAPARPTP